MKNTLSIITFFVLALSAIAQQKDTTMQQQLIFKQYYYPNTPFSGGYKMRWALGRGSHLVTAIQAGFACKKRKKQDKFNKMYSKVENILISS